LKALCAFLVGSFQADEDKILGPGTTTANPHKVELLLPPTGNNVQYDLDEGQKVTGIVTLNGVVHAWTFALSREPLHHALLDLKVFPFSFFSRTVKKFLKNLGQYLIRFKLLQVFCLFFFGLG
jgi:hypothetical protein